MTHISAQEVVLLQRGYFQRRIPTTDHDEEEDINLSLLKDTSNDTYTRAGSCLATKRFVVLRGVHGSGKTYLAKQLADNINQISKTKCQVQWIYDVFENGIPRLTNKALFVLDDIFYELQSKDEIQKTIKIVEDLSQDACMSKDLYVIVTIPTLVWKIQSEHFQNKTCFNHYVDLDDLRTEERTEIFNHYLKCSATNEEGDPTKGKPIVRDKVKNAIINFERYDYMGYPSCVAWISRIENQMELNDAGRFIEVPITRIKSEVNRLYNAKNTRERKMFLLLAFMAFNDGKLDVREHDENQLMDLARILFLYDISYELALQENDHSLFLLQEKYIKKISVGVYEFYLEVVRKTVLVIALEKNLKDLKKYVSHYMWKRVAVQKGKLPSDLSVGELSHLFIEM
ncbi:uncharacterized protein LOC134255526 [Saccostrea cucullata]|uniref:uncharacterized protein LOC134255526 n=1 Tax=Saccostrea cuccullata TaxID=36930 RepID=UPI002ED26D99